MNNQNNPDRKGRFRYLQKSVNQSLHKSYYSPERRERSFTYGPRRPTLDDFSPYRNIDYEHCRIKNNLVQQITMQNQLLGQQLVEYRAIVGRLEQQAHQKQKQIVFLQSQLTKDHSMYESIILQMKQQIKLVLSKNSLLQDQLLRLSQKRTQQVIMNESLKEEQFNLRSELSEMIASFQLRVTKARESSSQKKRLLKSPIQLRDYVDGMLKRNSTLQQFLKSILEMHFKIENYDLSSSELKTLWKWLKMLGQEHSYFRKLKKPLASRLCMSPDRSIQDLIDHALVKQLQIVF